MGCQISMNGNDSFVHSFPPFTIDTSMWIKSTGITIARYVIQVLERDWQKQGWQHMGSTMKAMEDRQA